MDFLYGFLAGFAFAFLVSFLFCIFMFFIQKRRFVMDMEVEEQIQFVTPLGYKNSQNFHSKPPPTPVPAITYK